MGNGRGTTPSRPSRGGLRWFGLNWNVGAGIDDLMVGLELGSSADLPPPRGTKARRKWLEGKEGEEGPATPIGMTGPSVGGTTRCA